jgi:peptide deformylase
MKKTELRLHTWPDKILKKKCKVVKKIDEEIKEIFGKMYSIMKKHKGIGIAANQVGLDLSLIVVESQDRVFKLTNPKIMKKEGKIDSVEGCLSFPGIELKINRFKRIWINAFDEKGKEIYLEAEDTLSIIFQHEIDHNNGIVFVDRLPLWEKLKVYAQLKRTKSAV